jgi:hypothetical protein
MCYYNLTRDGDAICISSCGVALPPQVRVAGENRHPLRTKNFVFRVPQFSLIKVRKTVAKSGHKKMVAHKVLPFFIFPYIKRSSTFFYSKGNAHVLIERNAQYHNKSKLPFYV